MRLSDLATGFAIRGRDVDITFVTEDSRKVVAGALFVAIVGSADDGHAYLGDAMRRGAVAIAGDRGSIITPEGIASVLVPDARAALATFASRYYGNPAGDLHLIGFTGTFGKTSTSDVLRALLAAEASPGSAASPAEPGGSARPGVLGSLGAKYGEFHETTGGLTTPAPVELHRALRGLRDAGANTVIMEVTSHALRMRRVDGLIFDGGLLAAIEPGEHTDFHRTFDDYLEAKRLFLDYLSPGAILAYDADNEGARHVAASRTSGKSVGFSLQGTRADVVFSDVSLDAAGAGFRLDAPLLRDRFPSMPLQMRSALLGAGHLRNVALAVTYAAAAGVDPVTAARVLADLRPLPRRMERYTIGRRTVLDDTAAHPESFRAAFAVARLLRSARLVVVYAVRGGRGADINSRNAASLAGLVAEHRADELLVTASRDATGPVDRVTSAELAAAHDAFARAGCSFVFHETLREAMARALERTRAGDLILLIGAQGMNEGRSILEELAG